MTNLIPYGTIYAPNGNEVLTERFLTWYHDLGALIGGKDPLFVLLEYTGTFAAAISGIRLASIKRFDWFGAYVIGFVTALGGGTVRDLMLAQSPFWVYDPSYLICTFVALLAVWIFGRHVISEQITWFVFDTIGLSLFTVIGLEKALAFGHSWWTAVIMGTITGAAGGVMRDVLINEVPLIFRKEIYALACAVGGIVFFVLDHFGINHQIDAIVCVAVIFLVRAIAIKFHLGVPVLSGHRLAFGPHASHRSHAPHKSSGANNGT